MLEIDVTDSAVKATGNLVGRLQNFNGPLGETGALLERKAKNRFTSQKDPSGKPWKPLAASTVAAKKQLGKSSSILSSDKILANSIFFNVSGNEVRVKPSVDYGIFHQLGTKAYKIRPKNAKALAFMAAGGMAFAKSVNHPGLPARPFMGFEADDADKIGQIFRDHLEGR